MEADALIALAHWFAASGAAAAGRMARWDAELPAWAKGAIAPAMAEPGHVLGTGHHPSIALAFGLIEASELAILVIPAAGSHLWALPCNLRNGDGMTRPEETSIPAATFEKWLRDLQSHICDSLAAQDGSGHFEVTTWDLILCLLLGVFYHEIIGVL